MKKRNILRLMLLIALTALLAVGCAKKPVPEVAAPAAPPVTAPAPRAEERPVTTEMPAQPVRGIQEQPVTEMPGAPEMAAVEGLQRIQFDFNQHTLTDQAKKTLSGNAAWMKANPAVKVVIEGHCDERGSDEYNLALGERRALAAKSYLVSLGTDSERLSVISYGEERPLDPARNEEAWSQNRRAEFKVVK